MQGPSSVEDSTPDIPGETRCETGNGMRLVSAHRIDVGVGNVARGGGGRFVAGRT